MDSECRVDGAPVTGRQWIRPGPLESQVHFGCERYTTYIFTG